MGEQYRKRVSLNSTSQNRLSHLIIPITTGGDNEQDRFRSKLLPRSTKRRNLFPLYRINLPKDEMSLILSSLDRSLATISSLHANSKPSSPPRSRNSFSLRSKPFETNSPHKRNSSIINPVFSRLRIKLHLEQVPPVFANAVEV
jgi:hypothetical protein